MCLVREKAKAPAAGAFSPMNSTTAPVSAPAPAPTRVQLDQADKIRRVLTDAKRAHERFYGTDYLDMAPKSQINALIAGVLAEGGK